jgi:hypothetical protein
MASGIVQTVDKEEAVVSNTNGLGGTISLEAPSKEAA